MTMIGAGGGGEAAAIRVLQTANPCGTHRRSVSWETRGMGMAGRCADQVVALTWSSKNVFTSDVSLTIRL